MSVTVNSKDPSGTSRLFGRSGSALSISSKSTTARVPSRSGPWSIAGAPLRLPLRGALVAREVWPRCARALAGSKAHQSTPRSM